MRRSNRTALAIIAILSPLMFQGCGVGIYVGDCSICVGKCKTRPRRTIHTTHVTGHGHGNTVDEAKRMARLDAIAKVQDKDIHCYDMDCTSGTVTGPGFRERWSSGFRETMGGGGSGRSEEGYDAEMHFRVKYW